MADEIYKIVHRYYITNQEGEISQHTPYYDSISEQPIWSTQANQLYCVERNGKKGIVDLKTGNVLFNPRYDSIEKTAENTEKCEVELLVKCKDAFKRIWYKFYQICLTGDSTKPQLTKKSTAQFYLDKDYEVCTSNFNYRKDNFVLVKREKKYGLMNIQTGRLGLDFQFDKIDLQSISGELVLVTNNGFMGYANVNTGKMQIETKYSELYLFNKNGFAIAILNPCHNEFNLKLWGIIDVNGNEIVPVSQLAYYCSTVKLTLIENWEETFDEYQQFDENVEFVVGFDVRERKWFLYTNTGIRIPYPINLLDKVNSQKLMMFEEDRYHHANLPVVRINQIQTEPNSFVFLKTDVIFSEESTQKQHFVLCKDYVLVERFDCIGYNQYLEIPDTVQAINFEGEII